MTIRYIDFSRSGTYKLTVMFNGIKPSLPPLPFGCNLAHSLAWGTFQRPYHRALPACAHPLDRLSSSHTHPATRLGLFNRLFLNRRNDFIFLQPKWAVHSIFGQKERHAPCITSEKIMRKHAFKPKAFF